MATKQQRLAMFCHVESLGFIPVRELISNVLMGSLSNGIVFCTIEPNKVSCFEHSKSML